MVVGAAVIVEAMPMTMSVPSCAYLTVEAHVHHIMNLTYHAMTRRTNGEWPDDPHTTAIASARIGGTDPHTRRS